MTQVTPSPSSTGSRFAGVPIADLFGHSADGYFDDDVWDFAGHVQTSGGAGKRNVYFDAAPAAIRDSLKELMVLALNPATHAAPIESGFAGVDPKKIATIQRALGGLIIDLQWLIGRSSDHTLKGVAQADMDALLQATPLSHRRTAALKMYARYSEAMSPDIDRLLFEPWPGRSGLDVAGGLPDRDGNTTPLFPTDRLGPWFDTATLLVQHGHRLIEVAQNPAAGLATVQDPNGRAVTVLSGDDPRLARYTMMKYVAAACAFVTVAFTGMRASEFDAIPRTNSLDSIAVRGSRRWLLTSYLTKGLPQARRESWLIPPVVHDAVTLMQDILDQRQIPADRVFPPTQKAPLFDRRALSVFDDDPGSKSTMRLGRAIENLGLAVDHLHRLGLVRPRTGADPNGRQLRRNLAVAVASRPNGAQAAMNQFKWQRPETAAGYFRVAPEGVALGQREVYEEVAAINRDLVVDALHDEFLVWEQQVRAGLEPTLPTGPDGRRKRDLFAAASNAMPSGPRVEEDDRRLRRILRDQADGIHLTEFGWCDFDEGQARCGGIGGPVPGKCEPDVCLNASTPSTALAAHRVRADRFLTMARDRSFPTLARDKARTKAQEVQRHLGPHLEEHQ